jgi:hypothetical protein
MGDIYNRAPDMILTKCAARKMQIEHLTSKTVLHPITLLAQAFHVDCD